MNALMPARAPLWSRSDGRRLTALVGIGAVVIAAAWFFAAGRSDAGDQVPLVSLSLLGVLVSMVGGFGWLRRGRRAVGHRTRLLLGSAPGATMDAPVAFELVAGPGAKWFHRADCPLVEGRNWPAAPGSTHESAGRRACPACKP
ncbi:MAG: hypothetical protein ACRD0O_07125 [Acidimicrobiia bacterium]